MSYISNVYDVLGDSMGDAPQTKGTKKDKLKEENKIAQTNNAQSQPASSPKVEQKAAPEKKVEGKGASPKIEAKKDDKKPAEPKKASNGSPKPFDNKAGTASPKETVSSPSLESAGESPVFPERGADFRNDNRSGPRSDKRDSKDKGFKDNKDSNGRGRSNDRKSGTGRSPTENKRGGSGKANWGTPEDEIKESIAVENEHAVVEVAHNGEQDKSVTKHTEARTEAPATSTTTTSTTPAPSTTDKPVDEEDKSITYAEYLRKQKQQTLRLGSSETRKAGEGVDAAAWADYQELRKDDPEKRPKKKEQKEKEKEKEEKEKVKKVALDEVFTIKYPSQPDRERRERRGGDRDRERRGGKTGGGAGRGDNRDNRDNRFRQGNARKENANAPNVTDQHLFPSLKATSPTLSSTSSPSAPLKA